MSKQLRTRAFVASSRAPHRLKRSALMLSAAVAAIALYNPAHAQITSTTLPSGGTVVAGSATIGTPTPTAMTVNQSTDRAVINWNSFDIGSGASVAFNQPSSTSITVNRVISGAAPSEIAGTMTANGIVAVLNPNGVLFSGTANVDVGGLIASTGDIDQAAFMAGGGMLGISGADHGEVVISAGATLRIADAGLGAFVAPAVRNNGFITATGGRVQLGAGTAFTLDLAGDGLLQIGLGANNPLVRNHGAILAEGGKVQISARQAAAYVNDLIPTGIVEVGGAVMEGGTIVLQAVGGDVNVSSNTSATGAVSVSGNRIYGAGDLDVTGALTLDVNQGAIANTTAANWINEALGVIGNVSGGTTVNLGAGLYRSGVRVDASNVTIDGHGVAEIGWTSGIENAVDIWGDSVTVRNLEISGPATPGYTSFAWGGTNSRGIFVNRFADNARVVDNDINGIRTGIIVDGRNTGTIVTGNTIDNTKSAISVQYTDGSNIDLTGNSEGTFGNEWGINVHLNGILQADGTTINPSTSSASGSPVGLLGTASLAEQARLLALSNANGGLAVQNIAYSAANRTRAYVKVGGAANSQGSLLSALGTIQAGVDAVVTGGTVHVDAGIYTGNVNISKSNVSLLSTAGRDATTIQGVAGAGALGTVVVAPGANNVTIGGAGQGFTILGFDNGNPGIENAALYLQGNHSGVTIRGNRITAGGDNGLQGEYSATLTGLTIDGNIFDGKTYAGAAPSSAPFSQQFTTPNVSRQLVVLGGGNGGGNTSNVTFTNNSIIGDSGLNTAVTIDAQGATISGNSFATTTGGFGSVLRARGTSTIMTGNVLDGTNVGTSANLLYLRNSVFGPGQADFAGVVGANTLIGAGAWSNLSATGFHTVSHSIQTAVNEAAAGAVVMVLPGAYSEGVTGVDYFGGAGGQKFGLYVWKDNITLRGVDAAGNAITDAADVAAFITANYQAGFGAQHFVSGNNVTIEGLGFKPVSTGTNKTLEVIGNGFTLRDSVIDNRGNATAANFYISDFEQPGRPLVESFTLEGNIFHGGTTASAMVVVAGGVGRNTAASNRIFSDNQLFGSNLAGQRGFQIQGRIPTTAWQQLTAGSVTVTGNYFDDVDVPVRTIGQLTEALAFDAVFRSNGNVFADGAVMAYAGSSPNARATLTAAGDEDFRITSKIADSIARAANGDTVRMLDGTYNLGTAQLKIDKSIALIGESEAGVIIDGRAVSANGLGTISVLADNVSLGSFTLWGSEVAGGNYGIKVQPNPTGHVNTPGGGSERVHNFAISDVTVRGSRRAELDLNGVIGATISNFTADGRRVADGIATDGAGVQITDSADVTLTGVHTLHNNWGGVALYQSNKASGYDGQTTNITINASLNQFDETNGLFAQLESTTRGFGTLNLAGFGHAVRNTGHRSDGSQFTYFRTDLADATAFALALGGATSSIEGYAGDHFSNVFTVVDGLTIGAATRDVRAGGTVNIGAGIFNEAVSITRSMTLAGAGMDATSITGGIAITSGFTGLTLRDFAVSGSASGTSVINNSGTLTNLTVDGVRIDGGSVANRHGFIGGQIGGDIAITDSEFLNIRGWAAFDTRSGASGNDGAQISSAVFANNRIDNTIGHVAFRQQIGAATLPDVTFAGNIVTNVGNATNSFGAIFKAFNADMVGFTGNNVSGVGTSGFNPAGEAAYGAVLMTRGAAALNVTDNVFTNNNQVLAIEPGRGLSTVTTLTDNVFTNNAYSIYLPANVTGGGTISFGAGNNFVAGANTVQHIVWRSGAALDLTSVMFGGTLASEMDVAGRFAVADLISDGIDRAGSGLARLAAGELYVTTGSGTDAALRALGLASAGDTVNLSAGTHTLSNTLFVTQSDVSILGQGSGATTIDASGHNSYGIRVHGGDVTLGGFALHGSSAAVGNSNYGIKVEAGGDAGARNTSFAIRDVAISGTRKTGLDLNAVVGAVIDGVSVTGVTNGNGIAITDSANVTVRNSTTGGNAWGGLALYQANNLAGGGSSQQLANITIEASNAFGEANGLYLQDSSASLNPGTLTLGGYDYAVRNAAHRSDGNQFVFFQKDLNAATAWALGLGTPSSSSIEGYAGDRYSNVFTVVDGLGIAAAARDVRAGGAINVGAGTYASGTVIAANGVTLTGATGARIDATHNGDNGITIAADGVTVQGFEIFGAADQPFNLYGWGSSITRGVVVMNGADNATVTDNTIRGVRNGVLIDGRNLGAAVTGNVIDNSKSAISVQYTDGSNIDISDNAEGANGNEWGIIAHLNGIWNGSSITASGGALGAATPLAEQQRLLDLSAANGGMAVYNQAWSALNRTRAYVTAGGSGGAQGSLLTPASLQAGLDAVVTGGTVHIAAGSYSEDVVLNGLRVLDMGAITVDSLTLGAGAAGTVIGTSITATGAIDLASGIVLGGDTVLTGGSVSLGAIVSPYELTLSGGTLAIGPAELASLTATGTSVTTAGVSTTGAQRYDGAVTLSGDYAAASFTATGLATLAGDAFVTTGGGAAHFGGLAGAHDFGVDTGAGTITLGGANGLASLSATGATILSAGAQTSGAQRYTGATLLNGVYATGGGSFAVNGATTLAGNTTIETGGGNAGFSTVGGGHGLAVDAGSGSVAFGAVDGLASLAVTGASIATAGVETQGAQRYTGATTLGGNYVTNGGSFAVTGQAAIAGGASVATDGGIASFGVVGGTGGLSIDAGSGAVMLGAVSGLAWLDAIGATIFTAGVSTSGAQIYTGDLSLNGNYQAREFIAAGAATLAGDTALAVSGGNVVLGTVSGAESLDIDAGAGDVSLGTVSGLASLSAAGATIATAGATTQGAQHYTGATTLGGNYVTDGGAFAVNGAATLAAAVSVATSGGDASFGTIAGPNSLGVDAGNGNVVLGAANGLTSLSAVGAAIVTAGAATSGAQSYTGVTTLEGAYVTGGDFTVAGAAMLGGATTVTTSGGNASFGTLGGANSLDVDAGEGNVTLGTANGLASLSATGATIVTAGARTTGAQSYEGATTLNGAYGTDGAAFTIDGITNTFDAVSVSTSGGDANFGAVGGSGGLSVDAAAGNVTLGIVDGVASLTAIGATIITAGANTTGAQIYAGATILNGSYASGGGFTVSGAATLGGATTVTTSGGNASFGTIGGANSLSVDAGTGNVALGEATGVTSLSVSGATITTAGATTAGAQSYTGATTLGGAYATGGGAFTVAGTTTLSGAATVDTGNGAIAFGTVKGASAGGQALSLNAGTGSATLGGFGAQTRLGAVSVNAGQTILGGATYAANSLSFTGGAGAAVQLTQATTTFNTTLPGGAGGAISIAPHLIGTVNGQQNVAFIAGNGLTLNSGDVAIGNVGSDAVRLGTMTVSANDFSAQTVKLASTFTSLLSGSQLFSANTLDTLGDVVAQVAGIESGPIRAGGSVAIDAGGSGTGSIIAGGPVSLGYTSDVARTITSTGPVSVSTTGSIGGAINSGGGVSLATTAGTISSTVAAAGPVSAQTTTGAITAAITSSNAVTLGTTSGAIAGTVQATGPVSATTTGGTIGGTINSSGAVTLATTSGTIASTVQAIGPVSATATSGSIAAAITSNAGVTLGSTSGTIGGSIQAGGPVDVSAGGAISTAVTTSGAASLTSTNGGVSSTINAGGPVAVAAPGPVTSSITSGGAVGVTSNSPVSVQINGGTVTVNAPGGTVTGVFAEMITDSRGTFVINDEPVIGSGTTDARQIIIDRFVAPAGGTVGADGTFQLPIGLALGLIAPAGDGSGVQRPPVAVNNVQRLGELLRLGYTAIIIQIDDTNLDLEEELDGAAQ